MNLVRRVEDWLRRVGVHTKVQSAALPLSQAAADELMDIVRGKTGPLLCPFGCHMTCDDCGAAIHMGADCPWTRRVFEGFGRGHRGLHQLICNVNPYDVLDVEWVSREFRPPATGVTRYYSRDYLIVDGKIVAHWHHMIDRDGYADLLRRLKPEEAAILLSGKRAQQ